MNGKKGHCYVDRNTCHHQENKTDLILIDEYRTIKVDWETAAPKLKVYRTAEWEDIEGSSTLRQLSLKAMPFTERSAP